RRQQPELPRPDRAPATDPERNEARHREGGEHLPAGQLNERHPALQLAEKHRAQRDAEGGGYGKGFGDEHDLFCAPPDAFFRLHPGARPHESAHSPCFSANLSTRSRSRSGSSQKRLSRSSSRSDQSGGAAWVSLIPGNTAYRSDLVGGIGFAPN